jgi:hypothetical protein
MALYEMADGTLAGDLLDPATKPIQHTIDNNEIGLAYCGQMLPYREVADATPWIVGTRGDVALWDNDFDLPTHTTCGDCHRVYMTNA